MSTFLSSPPPHWLSLRSAVLLGPGSIPCHRPLPGYFMRSPHHDQGHSGDHLTPRQAFCLQGYMGTLCPALSLTIPTPAKGVSYVLLAGGRVGGKGSLWALMLPRSCLRSEVQSHCPGIPKRHTRPGLPSLLLPSHFGALPSLGSFSGMLLAAYMLVLGPERLPGVLRVGKCREEGKAGKNATLPAPPPWRIITPPHQDGLLGEQSEGSWVPTRREPGFLLSGIC